MSSEPWTDEENDLIIADYFAMLADDVSGRPYSKAEHRRALLPLLNSCSERSIEFKHQNISAVLKGFGEEWVPGYKPAFNFQRIADAVALLVPQKPRFDVPQFGAMAFAHEIPIETHSRIKTDTEASHERSDEVMPVPDIGIGAARLQKPHEPETGGESLVIINGDIGWRRIGAQQFPCCLIHPLAPIILEKRVAHPFSQLHPAFAVPCGGLDQGIIGTVARHPANGGPSLVEPTRSFFIEDGGSLSCDSDITGLEGFLDAFQAKMSRDIIGDATHVLVDAVAMGNVCW